ncbi:hypothetical protein ACJO2E_18675 [Marinobacter sp. M1N3S26]|uniref:hypothetical protein n=1 Tax=Marinobacter sp. M1N3S26 TaxID=3382299 RepID=UPI00387AEDEA
MEKFYTVDRTGSLKEGLEISLNSPEINSPELQEHMLSMFPEGLSHHGVSYFVSSESRADSPSQSIELLFEYVRQAHYPELMSRFQSFFACQSIEEARLFRQNYGTGDEKIYEVLARGRYFKANMRLLDNNQTSLCCSFLAHKYWRSETVSLPNELWEILLELPVTIGRVVGQHVTRP